MGWLLTWPTVDPDAVRTLNWYHAVPTATPGRVVRQRMVSLAGCDYARWLYAQQFGWGYRATYYGDATLSGCTYAVNGGVRYTSMEANDTMTWTTPPTGKSAAGAVRVVVTKVEVASGGGTASLEWKPDGTGDWVAVGDVPTAGAGTVYQATTTLNLPSAAGAAAAFRIVGPASGTARIGTIVLLFNDWADLTDEVYIDELTPGGYDASYTTLEFAAAISYDSDSKWAGGYFHNSEVDDCKMKLTSELIVCAQGNLTVAPAGCLTDVELWTQNTDLYHGATQIGTVSESWGHHGNVIEYTATITAAEAIIIGTTYCLGVGRASTWTALKARFEDGTEIDVATADVGAITGSTGWTWAESYNGPPESIFTEFDGFVAGGPEVILSVNHDWFNQQYKHWPRKTTEASLTAEQWLALSGRWQYGAEMDDTAGEIDLAGAGFGRVLVTNLAPRTVRLDRGSTYLIRNLSATVRVYLGLNGAPADTSGAAGVDQVTLGHAGELSGWGNGLYLSGVSAAELVCAAGGSQTAALVIERRKTAPIWEG